MTPVSHGHPLPADAEAQVRGLLDGSLPAAARAGAMEHLRSCAACRERYDEIAGAEHALTGGAAVLGPAALERVGERIHEERAPEPRGRPRFALASRWVSWAAAGIAGLAIVVVVRGVTVDGGDFTPRGGGGSEASAGIRLYRISATGATELRDGDAVRRGERLGASYSSEGHSTLRWTVAPSDGARTPLSELDATPVAGAVDEPLDASVTVDERFGAGPAVVTATFSGGTGGDAERSLRLLVEAAP